MGAVAALLATAGLLFWVSTRIREAGSKAGDGGAGAEAAAAPAADRGAGA
jgi:hypothetical protein